MLLLALNGVLMKTNRLIFSLASVFLSACTQGNIDHPLTFNGFQALEAASGDAGIAKPSPGCTTKPNREFGNRSCLEIRQEFRYVVYVGKQIYCYWDTKQKETGIDYDTLAANLEQKITDETTFSHYFADVLQVWAASLHDGHVNVMPGDDMSRLEIVHALIRLRLLAPGTDHERLFVTSSKNSQVPVGAQILKINGVPVGDVLDAAETRQSGSTKRMRRFFAAAKIFDAIGIDHAFEPMQIEFQVSGSSTSKTVQIARKLEVVLPPKGSSGAPSTGEDLVQAQILPDKIAYLRIDGFGGSGMSSIFDTKMRQFRDAAALIVDVRENGGGDQSGNRILRWLTKQKIARYFTSTRRSDFLLVNRPDLFLMDPDPADSRFYQWEAREVQPTVADEGTFVGKPIVILTSSHCFSACDTFASAVQSNGLGVVVGEGTGGGTGTPEVFELPISELRFRYSVVRGQTAKRQWIEGVGTMPDIVAELDESDLTKDPISDSQTTRAVAYISTQLGKTRETAPETADIKIPTREKQQNLSGTASELLRLRFQMAHGE
jgi:C-terminal processing protease CtpA/Prc